MLGHLALVEVSLALAPRSVASPVAAPKHSRSPPVGQEQTLAGSVHPIQTTSLRKFIVLCDDSVTSELTVYRRSFFSAMGGGMGGGMGGMGSGFPGGSFTNAGRRGGARARGGSMFTGHDEMDDSDDYGGGMPGGMPGAQQRRPRPAAADDDKSAGDVIKPLKVSLEDLYSGTTKHLKIGRKLARGGQEDKILDVPIHAGYKSGTKIRFPRSGNEQPDGSAQDIVFVVEEKPHDVFTRDNNDLITSQKISLLEALTGSGSTSRTITHLNGSKVQVKLPAAIIKPGQETRILGKGMPIRKGGATGSFGDLIVKWDIEFPERLTSSQQDGLKKVLG